MSEQSKLYLYQQEAVDYLCTSARHGAVLALAPRLGKTVISILAADRLRKRRILVVAPLSLLRNWSNEILRWSPGTCSADVCLRHGNGAGGSSRWTVANYDSIRLHTQSFGTDYDLIIFDESVLLKNRKSKRTRACSRLVAANRDALLWELSGSPITRWLDDLWAQLNIVDPHTYRSYWRFAHEYCVVEHNRFGTQIVGNRHAAEDVLKRNAADVFFCRKQEDVVDLPPYLFERIEVPMAASQNRMYDQMAKEFMAELNELGDVVLAPNTLARLTRLIQIASDPGLVGGPESTVKIDAAVEMLSWLPKPAVLWTTFIRTAEIAAVKLAVAGYTVGTLTGSTPERDRQRIVDAFQTGMLDALVAHPGVGKYGLTLSSGKTAIYLERSFNSDDYYQSLHRIRHLHSTNSPHVVHLLSVTPRGESTVDAVIDRILERRYDNTQRLTARALLEEMR